MSLLFNKITLLQEIRALHAIIECNKDCVVTPNVKSAIQPLIDKFNIDINLGTTGNSSFINISHHEPHVLINGIKKSLLFPRQICDYLKSEWKDNRKHKISFVGLVTEKRKAILQSMNGVIVKNSSNGRVFPGKSWDEEYYQYLLDSKYTLCMDGDFIWTYRFFEACLCGSIPIIETHCDLYNGFKYMRLSDANNIPEWDEGIAVNNFNLAVKILTFSDEEQRNIRRMS
jgi:hypothetical protein